MSTAPDEAPRAGLQRVAWIVATVALIAGLLWLDANRGGPATELSRCNLAVSRADAPAADVLVMGSSRTGVAIDPVAMADMLAAAGLDDAAVDRIALGRNPLRANAGLLENYVAHRGAPDVLVFELSLLTERSVNRIDALRSGMDADSFLFRRDVNLLEYDQIASSPAVARPFSASESTLNRTRYALEGVVERTGALVYQAAHEPAADFDLASCDKADWTREPEWPADFAFSWDDAATVAAPADRIAELRAEITEEAAARNLRPWQADAPTGVQYPFDIDADYRAGELALLSQVVAVGAEHDVPIVLLPMTLYGTQAAEGDLDALDERFAPDAATYDLYAATGVDLSTYWYDDAHLEIGAATELTTALLAQHLLDSGWLDGAAGGVAS